ncbi:MAG TPA: transcription-repair coupling factor, partial [Nitrospiria bacterium]
MESLVDLGYARMDPVEHPGEFGVRGGIMDLFPVGETAPIRMEWAGDQIETLRRFDPETQITSQAVAEAWILPAGEPPERATSTLMDYLPQQTRRVWDEPGLLQDYIDELHAEVRMAQTSNKVDRSPGQYLTPGELEKHRAGGPSISLEGLHFETAAGESSVSFSTRSPESRGLGLKGTTLTEALKTLEDIRHGNRVLFMARTPVQQNRLMELFREHNLPAAPWTGDDATPEKGARLPFLIAIGDLSSGFLAPDTRLAVLTDEDLFGRATRHRPPPKPKGARFLASLEELEEGDYIVHVQHGIGRYEGLKRMTLQGFESDFLILRYLGGDTLYLPVDRLNLIKKYMGAEHHRPKMDRLGGITWARTTRRVKKAVETLAREILELYAVRESTPGHAFSKDTSLSREFDAAFPYEETPDQLQAIEDIQRDMEQPRPMDRLICGDVGYGKTEVAMRAAFKAVMDGKQVAVLVPTTLLAQQHGRNFRERFAAFPVRVETLSRFRTAREQKAVVADLAAGTVDIVIGTHRLIQKDVVFKNLGLLVVDEEQSFGVTHKERLMQLRKTVDTVTLSATPIPRTLQMSLTGVRELSIIETPPADRLAVRTILARFDPPVIRNAILRELARGGQVFFVHNRVLDIERIGTLIRDLVPEARLAIAHGQMHERELEKVMMRFVRQEADVLVTTTIIESGLDIPTANTIMINDAHRFGLADLYQLRGRVGRSGHQAYAYLLVPAEAGLTEEARARIQAIQEFCELGAGFRLAARDLEIRGSGNFLGTQQSGHIAAVGFEFYLQLIEQCVRELKGRSEPEPVEPTLNLRVSAFIPDAFIPDAYQRLSVYKRLSGLMSDEELAGLRVEIEDRYGAMPPPVRRLLEVVTVKLLARRLRILKLDAVSDGVVIAFDPEAPPAPAQVRRLLDLPPDQ